MILVTSVLVFVVISPKLVQNRTDKKTAEAQSICYKLALQMLPTISEPDHKVVIEIGGIPIAVQTSDTEFVCLLNERYGDYVHSGVCVPS